MTKAPIKNWRDDADFLADVFTWSASDQRWWFNRSDEEIQKSYELIIRLERKDARKEPPP